MPKAIRIAEILIIILFFAAPYSGFAQTTDASLTGQVTDQVGAALPNATVSVKNVGTDLTSQSASDARGLYRISPLPPGTYTLTVTANGFSTYVQQGIVLNVGLSATQNVALKVGSAQQTVSVTENAELINTTSPAIGMTVNQEEVSQLPLNGRDPQSLVFLAPGTTNGTAYGVAYNQGDFVFPQETGASSGVGAGRAGTLDWLRRFQMPTPPANFESLRIISMRSMDSPQAQLSSSKPSQVQIPGMVACGNSCATRASMHRIGFHTRSTLCIRISLEGTWEGQP
jgi:hypothetical protein